MILKDKKTNSNVVKTEQRGKLEGVVIGNLRRLEGTINVMIETRRSHKKYHKITTIRKKYLVQYDEKEVDLPIGTKVTLVQIAPRSRRKFFKIETKKR